MPRKASPLTDLAVRRAKPRASEFTLWDGGGLFLRVKPTGSKLWMFNYTRPHSRQRANLGIGAYPDLSLSDARKQADAGANIFEKVARQWLELKWPKVSATYFDKVTGRLELYAFPKLGSVPVHKLSAVATIEVIRPLADRDKLETVKKLCRWINEVMVHAVNAGLIHANLLAGIGKVFSAPKVVNLPTIKPEELPAFMAALNQSRTKIVTRCLVQWQLRTMTRPGEAAATRWEEIDHAKALWTIPAASCGRPSGGGVMRVRDSRYGHQSESDAARAARPLDGV